MASGTSISDTSHHMRHCRMWLLCTRASCKIPLKSSHAIGRGGCARPQPVMPCKTFQASCHATAISMPYLLQSCSVQGDSVNVVNRDVSDRRAADGPADCEALASILNCKKSPCCVHLPDLQPTWTGLPIVEASHDVSRLASLAALAIYMATAELAGAIEAGS